MCAYVFNCNTSGLVKGDVTNSGFLQMHKYHFPCTALLICLMVFLWILRGERPVERHSTADFTYCLFPPLLGLYFWGLSSGLFKRRLVTAGTSWTKLLLPASLLRCSHSPLIGFDSICLIPHWKKKKGTWRCCRETEVWPLPRHGGILLKKTKQKKNGPPPHQKC